MKEERVAKKKGIKHRYAGRDVYKEHNRKKQRPQFSNLDRRENKV